MDLKVKVLISLLCLTAFSVWWRISELEFPPQLQDTSCACNKCLRDVQRLNKSVEPFLSANHNLSEDGFNWWKKLQYEKRTYGNYATAVGRLFQMFPPSPDVVEPSPDGCRTCAVVGNSGNLKGSHYGALIDFHDIVIRMNTGPTKGYEVDVGNKTSHRVMYPESATDLENYTHLVLLPFKIQDVEWLVDALSKGFSGRSYMPVKARIKANKHLVMVVNPDFMRYVHETWLEKKGKYPSTGFMALVLAMHICDEVNVFGYGADERGSWSHYWEKLEDKKFRTGVHPGSHEHNVILQLAEQQKITIYRGF